MKDSTLILIAIIAAIVISQKSSSGRKPIYKGPSMPEPQYGGGGVNKFLKGVQGC